MLFFIDETWQELAGRQVAALGAVAIPQASYNRFCREVFAIKQNVLGASELSDAELKGAKCFAKRAFRARATDNSGSKLLIAADAMFDALAKHRAHAFAPSSDRPELRPYMDRVAGLQLSWRDQHGRLHRTIRGVGTSNK